TFIHHMRALAYESLGQSACMKVRARLSTWKSGPGISVATLPSTVASGYHPEELPSDKEKRRTLRKMFRCPHRTITRWPLIWSSDGHQTDRVSITSFGPESFISVNMSNTEVYFICLFLYKI